MKDAIQSCTVAKSSSFRVQVSNHIAQTVLPWNGEVQKGWHAGEVMLWFTRSIRTSRIHALPFGAECALSIPVSRDGFLRGSHWWWKRVTKTNNISLNHSDITILRFLSNRLQFLVALVSCHSSQHDVLNVYWIGWRFPFTASIHLPTSGLLDFTKLPMNSQFGRICNPWMACWHDSLLSNDHSETQSHVLEVPAQVKKIQAGPRTTWPKHVFSQDYDREIDGTQYVLLYTVTYDILWHPMTRMPIETVAWIWVLGVKSPNLIYSFAYFTYFKTLSSSHGTATCICTWCGIRTWWDFLDRFVCQHVNITDLHTLWWDDRVQLYLRSCKYCNRWIWYVLEVLPLPC